jgi:hypothetical protein
MNYQVLHKNNMIICNKMILKKNLTGVIWVFFKSSGRNTVIFKSVDVKKNSYMIFEQNYIG